MHNLSSRGGAYDFQADFVEKKLSNDGTARKKAVQPDPSPVKRPDPTSKSSNPITLHQLLKRKPERSDFDCRCYYLDVDPVLNVLSRDNLYRSIAR